MSSTLLNHFTFHNNTPATLLSSSSSAPSVLSLAPPSSLHTLPRPALEARPKPPRKRSTVADHECQVCQQKFTRSEYLKRHMRKHTGERPYKCGFPGCSSTFSRHDNMLQHSRCHEEKGHRRKRRLQRMAESDAQSSSSEEMADEEEEEEEEDLSSSPSLSSSTTSSSPAHSRSSSLGSFRSAPPLAGSVTLMGLGSLLEPQPGAAKFTEASAFSPSISMADASSSSSSLPSSSAPSPSLPSLALPPMTRLTLVSERILLETADHQRPPLSRTSTDASYLRLFKGPF